MKRVLDLCAIFICISLIRAQNETTTLAPIITTTSAPLTTLAPAPPMPTEGSWNVTDGNVTCIRADLKIRFKIPVGNDTEYLLLSPNATTTGSNCYLSNVTQVLMLHDENFVVSFLFEKDSGNAYVKNLSLVVSTEEGPEFFSTDEKMFSVKTGNSYMCVSTITRPMGNATIEVFAIRIKAFGGTEKDFGTIEECEADDTISDIVPIAVACALAALIIIVLIAYLVGRRRSRQKGYNSV